MVPSPVPRRRAAPADRDVLGAATNTHHELRRPRGLHPGTRGGWLRAAEAAEDPGTTRGVQVPRFWAFAGWQRVVRRRAACTPPPWVCLCPFPEEKCLEGVEITRDAARTNWLLLVEEFCDDVGNRPGQGGHSACPSMVMEG